MLGVNEQNHRMGVEGLPHYFASGTFSSLHCIKGLDIMTVSCSQHNYKYANDIGFSGILVIF